MHPGGHGHGGHGKGQGGAPQPLGSEAFGFDPKGRPTGAAAFGGPDQDDPLRGALLFGNDPKGAPTGAESFGGASADTPLRGALLFGNDPKGAPTGSESFGGAEPARPLKGALLFGNDPQGGPTGSEAFGSPDARFQFRGSGAFGAPQLILDKLYKDEIGYDFAGVMLTTDEASIAGVRKDPRNRVRERVLGILGRRLAVKPDHLRHGLSEDSLPWGRIGRDRSLDAKLAGLLRDGYRKAPGEVLGIGHVRDILEQSERMHTFMLQCEWDLEPIKLMVLHNEKTVAWGVSALHKQHRFFIFKDEKGRPAAYCDSVRARAVEQRARVRSPSGETIACFELKRPGTSDALGPTTSRFLGVVLDKKRRPAIEIEEERSSEMFFRARMRAPESGEDLGLIEDALRGGKIRTRIELDCEMPRVVAWGLAAVLADLARLRRKGWPDVREEGEEEPVESIEEALGPRRRR